MKKILLMCIIISFSLLSCIGPVPTESDITTKKPDSNNIVITIIKPKIVEFTIVPSSIKKGESVIAYWNVEDTYNTKIKLDNYYQDLNRTGSKIIIPDSSGDLRLIVEKEGVIVDSASRFIKVIENKKIDTNITYGFSKGIDDGRFTIGANDKRLMFGYPIPFSTSHFIVKINDKYASNNPYFSTYYNVNNVKYISSKREFSGVIGSIKSRIKFEFEGFQIIQSLIPVDKEYKEIPINQFGQHYKIEYQLINCRKDNVEVGLMVLVDTMIDDNDFAKMKVDNQKLEFSKEFVNPNIPDFIKVYKRDFDESNFYAILKTNQDKRSRPDKLYIGNWPYFHSVLWNVNIAENENYFDSAILLKWDSRISNSNDTSLYTFFYGLPQKGDLRMLFNTPVDTEYETIQFDIGESTISNKNKSKLEKLVMSRKIVGVIIEGYGDAVGSDKINFKISETRANNVRKYLIGLGLDGGIIIPKPFGERFADQSPEAQKKGNPNDRMCKMVVMFEK